MSKSETIRTARLEKYNQNMHDLAAAYQKIDFINKELKELLFYSIKRAEIDTSRALVRIIEEIEK